jgi:plasmid stability protein
MSTITIRNLPEEVHRALKVRAGTHGRSTEAEVRLILECTVRPTQRVRMGEALQQLGRQINLMDADAQHLQQQGREPATPMELE